MRDPRQRLLMAVLLALLVGGGAFYYMHQQQVALESAKKEVKPVQVLYTAKPIPARTVITKEMVKVKEVPQAAVTPSMYPVEKEGELLGKVSIAAFISDEPFAREKVVEKGAKMGLSFIVPKGKRALSIPVTIEQGVANLLKPGDFVDVVSTFKAEAEGGQKGAASEMSVVIYQNAQVLALDQQMELAPTPSPSAPQPKPQGAPKTEEQAYKLVTLAVDPEKLPELHLLSKLGQNRLALRAFNDYSRVAPQVASLVKIARTHHLPVFTLKEEAEVEKKKEKKQAEAMKAMKDIFSVFRPKEGALPSLPQGLTPTVKVKKAAPKGRTITVYQGAEKTEVTIP